MKPTSSQTSDAWCALVEKMAATPARQTAVPTAADQQERLAAELVDDDMPRNVAQQVGRRR